MKIKNKLEKQTQISQQKERNHKDREEINERELKKSIKKSMKLKASSLKRETKLINLVLLKHKEGGVRLLDWLCETSGDQKQTSEI